MTYAGFKDENGVLPRDAIRKQFNGSLFYEYAAKMGKSMKEKKVGGCAGAGGVRRTAAVHLMQHDVHLVDPSTLG